MSERIDVIRINLTEPGGYSALSWRQAKDDIEWLLSEYDKLQEYIHLLERGMGSHEARATVWPDGSRAGSLGTHHA